MHLTSAIRAKNWATSIYRRQSRTLCTLFIPVGYTQIIICFVPKKNFYGHNILLLLLLLLCILDLKILLEQLRIKLAVKS